MSDQNTPRRRYSSRRGQTLALGTIAAASVTLTGCGDDFDGEYAFTSVDQCVSQGFERDICNAEYQQALSEHAKNAPRFDARAACEAEYGVGKCNEIAEAGTDGQRQSFFVPFLAGYVMSSALRNFSNYGAYRDYRSTNTYYGSTPLYRDRFGRESTFTRTSTGTGAATTTRRPDVKPLNRNTRTASRNGFGGRSASRSRGWGG